MATYRHNLPLFAGTQKTEDLFLHTLHELDKEVVNELEIEHALYAYLKMNNLIKYQGDISTEITIPLLDKPNSTVKDFTGYDDADLTPQDATSYAKFLWGHIAGTQMYNREEMVKNSGEYKLLDLIETKTTQLKESMNNHFASRLIGNQDSDGRSILGLGRIMTPGAIVGGIDPSASGYAYWDVHNITKSGVTKYSLADDDEYRAGMRKTRRACTLNQKSPDVIFCGEDVWDKHCAMVENKMQFSPAEADAFKGFEAMKDNGKIYIYEENLPAKRSWFMNFKHGIEVRVHKGTNFQMTDWENTPNKVQTKHRQCLLYASTVCKKRNLNGVIDFE
ncbi:phage major capsid protein [Endozoicomonas sp. 2B-B]